MVKYKKKITRSDLGRCDKGQDDRLFPLSTAGDWSCHTRGSWCRLHTIAFLALLDFSLHREGSMRRGAEREAAHVGLEGRRAGFKGR